MTIDELKFDANGLIPAVVQDYFSKQVLTVAYMNRESLEISMKEGRTCFYSRSRRCLWRKGETSGKSTDEQTKYSGYTEDKSDDDRNGNGKERREYHLMLCCTCGDGNAGTIIGCGFAFKNSFYFAELTTHFLYHLLCGTSNGFHRESAE